MDNNWYNYASAASRGWHFLRSGTVLYVPEEAAEKETKFWPGHRDSDTPIPPGERYRVGARQTSRTTRL